MQRRPPARERDLRNHVLNRSNERVRLAQSAHHVLIPQQSPEAVPRVAVRHRTAPAHVAIQIMRAGEIFGGQRIEVVGKPRVLSP